MHATNDRESKLAATKLAKKLYAQSGNNENVNFKHKFLTRDDIIKNLKTSHRRLVGEENKIRQHQIRMMEFVKNFADVDTNKNHAVYFSSELEKKKLESIGIEVVDNRVPVLGQLVKRWNYKYKCQRYLVNSKKAVYREFIDYCNREKADKGLEAGRQITTSFQFIN